MISIKKISFGDTVFQKIIKGCLFLLVFLMPLFWSPFSSSSYDFGKYKILFALAAISFLAWSAKIILKDKKISFNLNLLDISVLSFLGVGVLSTIFSVDKYTSLFGSYGSFSDGLIGMLSVGVVYFLIRGAKKQIGDKLGFTVEGLLKTFFISFSILLLVAYFSVSGLGNKFSIDNVSIQQRIFNTVSFSLEGLSVFVSIVMVLLAGVIISSEFKVKTTFLKILLFASLGLLIVVDIIPAWIILSIGLSSLTFFALLTGSFKKDMHKLLLPISLVIISVLFIFINFRGTNLDFFFVFPKEQYLEQSDSYDIAIKTMQEGPKNILIGSGPGTWLDGFLKNRSVSFNEESVLWGSRLNYAGNYISSLVATTGVLGVISYLSLIGTSLMGFYLLKEKRESIPYISAIIAVLVGQFIYYQNTSLMFLAWFIFGLGSVAWKDSLSDKFSIKKTISSERTPELNLGFSVILVLLGLSVMSGLYFTTRECLAESYYSKTQNATELNDAISYLESAIQQNPYRVIYRTTLTQAYLSQMYTENNKPEEEKDQTILQEIGNKIIEQTLILERDFSGKVNTWEVIGVIRRDVAGSAESAIEAFKKALEIDKKNPVLHLEIGKLYISLEDMEKSRESFVAAQEVKPNYLEAIILEALTYEEGDIETAIAKFKEAELLFPLNEDVKYHLGRLYYGQEEIESATSYFIETIQLNPNNSNALYSLALIHENQGSLEIAIALYERVLELNPGYEELIKSIESLKSQLTE